MLIPGYKVCKMQLVDDYGSLVIVSVKEGEADRKVFKIDSKGKMEFSVDALEQAREQLEFPIL